jgi:hypothetical protein
MFEYDNEIFTGQPFDLLDDETVGSYYESPVEAGWVDADLLCPDYAVTSDTSDSASDTPVTSQELQLQDVTGEIVPVDQEVTALTQHAVAVAEAIAAEEPFSYTRAEMSMRPVGALFNGVDALNGVALAKLSPAEVTQLHNLALPAMRYWATV